jgi:hypothetical protein
MGFFTALEMVGDAVPGDSLNPNQQTLGGATDLVFTRTYKVGADYASYLFQILSTTAAPTTRVTDDKITTAYLVKQRLQRVDDVNSHLVCVFASLPSTWMTDYRLENVTMPGVLRSSFNSPGEFNFRSSPVSFLTPVRYEHAYFLGPPIGIATYSLFAPVSVQGSRTSILDDNTDPSSDFYISMVNGRGEFVVESGARQWLGDIFERITKFAVAQ